MKTLFFCSHDGNFRAVFKSESKANDWKMKNGSLAFVNEISYDEGNSIVLVGLQDFDDFIESISDEVGSEEFNRVKKSFEEEFKFVEFTND